MPKNDHNNTRKRALSPSPSPSSSSSSSSSFTGGRVELFFKNPSELKERVRFLRSEGVSSFNLVNKDKKDDVDGWVRSIREVYPDADVCAHYSLKHNKVPRAKGTDRHEGLLMRSFDASDADELLLISGSGEKKAWNTIRALRALKRVHRAEEDDDDDRSDRSRRRRRPSVAVAYNPYFPSDSDQEREDRRLVEKLETDRVSRIYLQFGTDTEKLAKGLALIRRNINSIRNDDDDDDVAIAIAGSVFLPTKKLVAQQKFRPWNGVFLSRRFLEGGPEEAESVVIEMLRIYRENGVEPLWEAPGIRTEKDLSLARDLLRRAAAATVDDPSSSGRDDEAVAVATPGKAQERGSRS
eukprot:CAMPEP_0197178806 /NCGR_PEP_ID=MMETSP1423-20130617/3973_1 /TAXON_ID=476441 /ORGANISM="Pseudo-nitzschia heimii, Strain UNC1101" /LENGTH=352 /DNA_ID=CAMNT_0042628619 /DNA_START=129 /DNA_END=1187 /DNA_ORIENTATION=+